jgi:putative FmdB family regulatory protein
MPIFEYRCARCDERFEVLVSRADARAPACPRCGGGETERMLSAFAVVKPSGGTGPGPCGSSDCGCRRASSQ